MKAIVRLGGLALLASLAGQALAEPNYPSRQVTFVVPYAPGGVTDILARRLGQKLEQRFGKPFVVENRPGASAVTAAVAVANAPPDGYTVMMASSTPMALNVTVRKSLPYDPTKDLTPLALIARVPYVLVVNPALPIRSVDDLVKLAKARPGEFTFGTPGAGTFHHLNAEMFKSRFELDLVNVPYKGTMPALNNIIGGHIAFMFSDVPPALPLIQAGKLRALGVTTGQRLPAAPEIPPLAEVGIPGYDASSWHMVVTTGGTPEKVVETLHQELRVIMEDSAIRKALIDEGSVPQTSPSPGELKRFVQSEIVRWGEIVKKAGIAGSE